MLNWEWKREPNTIALFVHLLLMANSDDTYKYKGEALGVGQLVTSLDDLRSKTGMTLQEVRTALKHLIKTGEVTSKSTNKFRIITICNYASYQLLEIQEQQATNKQITSKSTGKITSQLTSKQQAQDTDLLGSCEGVVNEANKPANILANIPPNNIQEYILYILSTEDEEENKIKILESIIKNISQNSQNAKNAEADQPQPSVKTAPKKAEPSGEFEQQFEEFRKAYKGSKRGLAVEFENFKKKNPNWREIVPLLMPALQRLEEWRAKAEAAGEFVPSWANLQTWINQKRWTEELPTVTAPTQTQQQIPTPATSGGNDWEAFGSIDK